MNEMLIAEKELSAREVEVLELLANDHNAFEGAEVLYISHHTFRAHVLSIHKKLGVSTNAGAVAVGFKQGYLEVDKP